MSAVFVGTRFLTTLPFTISAIPGYYVLTCNSNPQNVVLFDSCTLPNIFAKSYFGTWGDVPICWSLCDFNASFGVPNIPIPTPAQLFSLLLGIRIDGPCNSGSGGGVATVANEGAGIGVKDDVNSTATDVLLKSLTSTDNSVTLTSLATTIDLSVPSAGIPSRIQNLANTCYVDTTSGVISANSPSTTNLTSQGLTTISTAASDINIYPNGAFDFSATSGTGNVSSEQDMSVSSRSGNTVVSGEYGCALYSGNGRVALNSANNDYAIINLPFSSTPDVVCYDVATGVLSYGNVSATTGTRINDVPNTTWVETSTGSIDIETPHNVWIQSGDAFIRMLLGSKIELLTTGISEDIVLDATGKIVLSAANHILRLLGLPNASASNLLYFDPVTQDVSYFTPPVPSRIQNGANTTFVDVNSGVISATSPSTTTVTSNGDVAITSTTGKIVLNSGNNDIELIGIPSATKTNVLYIDTVTHKISYSPISAPSPAVGYYGTFVQYVGTNSVTNILPVTIPANTLTTIGDTLQSEIMMYFTSSSSASPQYNNIQFRIGSFVLSATGSVFFSTTTQVSAKIISTITYYSGAANNAIITCDTAFLMACRPAGTYLNGSITYCGSSSPSTFDLTSANTLNLAIDQTSVTTGNFFYQKVFKV